MVRLINSELLLVQWMNLQPELSKLPTFTDVPAKRPSRFVTIERTGGVMGRDLDHPTIAVQVWGTSRVEASKDAYLVAEHLKHGLVLHPQIGRVTVTGPYNFPDMTAGHPRYQIVLDLVMVKHSATPEQIGA